MTTFCKYALSMIAATVSIIGLMIVLAHLVAYQPLLAVILFGPLFAGLMAWIVLDNPDECM